MKQNSGISGQLVNTVTKHIFSTANNVKPRSLQTAWPGQSNRLIIDDFKWSYNSTSLCCLLQISATQFNQNVCTIASKQLMLSHCFYSLAIFKFRFVKWGIKAGQVDFESLGLKVFVAFPITDANCNEARAFVATQKQCHRSVYMSTCVVRLQGRHSSRANRVPRLMDFHRSIRYHSILAHTLYRSSSKPSAYLPRPHSLIYTHLSSDKQRKRTQLCVFLSRRRYWKLDKA